MIVARTVAEARAALAALPRPLGFVPTMGALHEGHLSLVHAARDRCAGVAASIFVNPTQFGRGEDLGRYPRDEARDLRLFEDAGVGVVFAPTADDMYPEGFATLVHVGGPLTETFEGASRGSHFDGVAVIVVKLLSVVQPDVLLLGQKDAQQLAVLRRVVRDLDLPVEVLAVPTVREADGLALSSRNRYLTPEERAVAPRLYSALLAGQAAAASPGARGDTGGSPAATPVSAKDIIVAATSALLRSDDQDGAPSCLAGLPDDETPASPRFSIDYLAIVDADTFRPQVIPGPRALLIAAAGLGTTRLIDNIGLSDSSSLSPATPSPSAYPTQDATA